MNSVGSQDGSEGAQDDSEGPFLINLLDASGAHKAPLQQADPLPHFCFAFFCANPYGTMHALTSMGS